MTAPDSAGSHTVPGVQEVRSTADRQREVLRTTVMGVWLAAFFLLLLTWLHVYVLVKEGWQTKVAVVERDLANLARVSEEHAWRTFRNADQVVRFVQDRYDELGSQLDLIGMTKRGLIDVSTFNQVGIIQADGMLQMSNRPVPTPIDLSDREHYRVHVTSDTGQLFVSKPVLGRATQRWSIQLTRRLNRTDGSFNGVVVVSVDATYFTRFFSDLNLGDNGMAALYGLDGVARARQVGDKEDFGADGSSSPVFKMLAEGKLDGGYSNVSVVDGVERLYHYRKVRDYPLLVVMGRDVAEVRSQHATDRNALVVQASLVTALILTLAFAISRFLWRLRRELLTRQAAQAQVIERTDQLNAIFELSPDGFVFFDRYGQLRYVSPTCIKLLSASEATLMGLNEQEFVAWLVLRCRRDMVTDALASSAQLNTGDEVTVSLLRPAGRVLSITAHQGHQTTGAKVMCFRDITRETEVAQMKSEFLATAAHELRTPMASVYGFAEVLMNQPDLEKAARDEFVGIIYRQSQNIADILNQLLDLARIEARRGKDFNFEALDAEAWLRDLLRGFKSPPGRSAPLLSVVQGCDLRIEADSGKLRQAMLNVLSNAFKYSPAGGQVRVQLECAVSPAGQPLVCLRVSDSGIGMTPAQVERVFERFYRADPSGKLPGSGLGMSIVKEIMTLHQGDAVIESVLGVGTTVVLRLPVRLDNQQESGPAEAETSVA